MRESVLRLRFASADTPPTPTPTIAPPTNPTPDTPTPSSPPPEAEQPGWPGSPDQAEQEAALIKMLSEMFGVDEAEVKAALDEMRPTRRLAVRLRWTAIWTRRCRQAF